MIPAAIALFALLFGGGSTDMFYIDKMDKGIKEYVVDKERKKELLDSIKVADKAMAKFEKELSKHIKELLKKNTDRDTPDQWFEDFFEARMNDRMDWQEFVLNKRIYLQNTIKPEEWGDIINSVSEEATKDNTKAKSKAEKNSDKLKKAQDKFRSALDKAITDEARRAEIIVSLDNFIDKSDAFGKAYENINVNESSEILDKQDVSRDDLIKINSSLDDIRSDYYVSYLAFYMDVRNNTTEDEWKPIIKQFNNLVK
jgi:hypothetical protein